MLKEEAEMRANTDALVEEHAMEACERLMGSELTGAREGERQAKEACTAAEEREEGQPSGTFRGRS